MVHVMPWLCRAGAQELTALGFDPEAVQMARAEYDKMHPVQPAMTGVQIPDQYGRNPNYTIGGFSKVATKGIRRWYDQLCGLKVFSTKFAEDYLVAGHPGVKARLEVPLYDNLGEAHVDDYSDWTTREPGGCRSSVEVVLKKVDDVADIYARDIEHGIDIDEVVAALLSRVHNKSWNIVMSKMAIGTQQGDDEDKTISGLTLPYADPFSFAYAQQVVSECIQPRVETLLVNSSSYGALKRVNGDSLGLDALDFDTVKKVQGLSNIDASCYGVALNRRGVAVGMQAMLIMPNGGFGSVEQINLEDQPLPMTLASFPIPGKNCIRMVAATYMGVEITDVSAVKPLLKGAAPAPESGNGGDQQPET